MLEMDYNVVGPNTDMVLAWSDFLASNFAKISAMRRRAAEIHASVNQKYDELPYSFHTNFVSMVFMQHGSVCFASRNAMVSDGLSAVFGAIFHDTIEDARLTYNDVKQIASEFMGNAQAELAADIVYALTNEKGKNRAERENDKYFELIRQTPYAPCIKVCDRYANAMYAGIRDTGMCRKYSREMADFLNRLVTEKREASSNIPWSLYMSLNSYPINMEVPVKKTGDMKEDKEHTTLDDLKVLKELKRQMEGEDNAPNPKRK